MNKEGKKVCDRNSNLGLILLIILWIIGIGLGSGRFLLYSLGFILFFESALGLSYKKIKAFYAPILGGAKYLSGKKAEKYIVYLIIMGIIFIFLPSAANFFFPSENDNGDFEEFISAANFIGEGYIFIVPEGYTYKYFQDPMLWEFYTNNESRFKLDVHSKNSPSSEIFDLVPQNVIGGPIMASSLTYNGNIFLKAEYDSVDLEEFHTLPEEDVTHYQSFGYITELLDKKLFFYVYGKEEDAEVDKWFEENVLKTFSGKTAPWTKLKY